MFHDEHEPHESPRPLHKTRATPSLSQTRAVASLQLKPRRRVQDKRPPRKKPYSCDHCNKMFDRPCSLAQHLRTHTGERPHVCSKCDRPFATKSNLYRHCRRCDLDPPARRRPGKRSPNFSDAQGSAAGSSEPQPTKRARGARYSLSRRDSDEFMDHSEREEEGDDTPDQMPTVHTASGSGGAPQKNASSSTIPRGSFATVSNNGGEASYSSPPSLDFATQAYPPDSPNPHSLKRRTTLDRVVFAIDDAPSHSTHSNSSAASLPGRGKAWNDVGLYMGISDPSPSRRVTMEWGALPDSFSTYGRTFSPLQEAYSVRSNTGFSGAVIGRNTATVEQNPTYGPMPTSLMFPYPQPSFGSYTGGNGVSFDPSSWTDSSLHFQFHVEVGRELTEQRQLAPSRRGSARIEAIEEGDIPAAPAHGGSIALAHTGESSIVSPAPASSPALSMASSSCCSAGSGSVAPSMLSLSPPPPSSSPFDPITGAAHERRNTHTRTNSFPAAGVVVGNQRTRRNALSTMTAQPSTVAPPPVPAFYDPLGLSPDSCLQSRPTASSETLGSIPPISSVSLVGPANGIYLLPSVGDDPSAIPHYYHVGPQDGMVDLTSATNSASRTDPALYSPHPGPPPLSQQSRFDAQHYPHTY